MKKYFFYCFLFFGLLLINACNASKKATVHSKSPYKSSTTASSKEAGKTELMRISESTMEAEEKMDKFFDQYVTLVQQGLQYSNTSKGADYVMKFQTLNQAAINKIVAQTNTWVDKLDKKQSRDLGLRVVKKPYTRMFLDNVPNFNTKYKAYPSINETTAKVMGVFTKIRNKAK